MEKKSFHPEFLGKILFIYFSNIPSFGKFFPQQIFVKKVFIQKD